MNIEYLICFRGFVDAILYKIFYHPNEIDIYYSGFISSPQRTILMKENNITGATHYIKYYSKLCNFKSHFFTSNFFYWISKGSVNFYALMINNVDGSLIRVITPAGYSWNKNYWNLVISDDETEAFISARKSGTNTGAIWKWEVGTLDPIDCIELTNLHVPLILSRIISDKIFLEVNNKATPYNLNFIYLDLEIDSVIWNK